MWLGDQGSTESRPTVHGQMRGCKTVETFHEPFPLIPSFSPSGGEGARRAVEGDSDRFMASIHVRILEVSPPHEPRSRRRESALILAAKANKRAGSRRRLRPLGRGGQGDVAIELMWPCKEPSCPASEANEILAVS